MLSHYGIFARYVIVLIIISVKSVLVKSLGLLRLLVGFMGPIYKTRYGPMSYIGLTLRPEQMAWFIYRNIAWSVSVAIHAFGRQSLVWLKLL